MIDSRKNRLRRELRVLVERRVDAVFARIDCVPLAAVAAAGHVLVLEPVTAHIPARPAEETSPAPPKRGAVK